MCIRPTLVTDADAGKVNDAVDTRQIMVCTVARDSKFVFLVSSVAMMLVSSCDSVAAIFSPS